MKYYVIADLHGRYDLLEKVLNKLGTIDDPNSTERKIIFLGDYIDRGLQSRQIIQRLMAIQEVDKNVICLKGNHEDMMYQTIRKPLSLDWWIGNGGDATLQSYGAYPLEDRWYRNMYDISLVSQDHLNWIRDLPVYYETPGHVFVHAGIPKDNLDLESQDEERMMWMLYSKDDHGGWQEKHVVHGHHQFADGPHEWEFRTDLDCYAWKTGRLVIGVFDDTQGKALEYIEVFDVDP